MGSPPGDEELVDDVAKPPAAHRGCNLDDGAVRAARGKHGDRADVGKCQVVDLMRDGAGDTRMAAVGNRERQRP